MWASKSNKEKEEQGNNRPLEISRCSIPKSGVILKKKGYYSPKEHSAQKKGCFCLKIKAAIKPALFLDFFYIFLGQGQPSSSSFEAEKTTIC